MNPSKKRYSVPALFLVLSLGVLTASGDFGGHPFRDGDYRSVTFYVA